MIEQKQIQEWLQSGTITQEQATKMLADSAQVRKEESSGKFITWIVSLGATLFGLGVILFVALNWLEMPNFLKIVLLLGSTFGSYYLGYVFAYQKQNYPKVGAALIFLGALLFGASIFLIAQIYNMNTSPESTYILLGMWLVGVLPVVYGFLSKPIAALSSLLFLAFIYLVFRTEIAKEMAESGSYGYANAFFDILIVGIVSGIMLFGIGGFHYISEKLQPIGRIYRLFGLQLSLLIVFLLSMKFPYYAFNRSSYRNLEQSFEPSGVAVTWVVLLGVVALLFSVTNLFFNFAKTKIFLTENAINIVVLVITFFAFFFVGPESAAAFRIIFTITFAGIILAMLYIGYENMDMTVVNKATSFAVFFIIVKYFEWFWGSFNPYLFFMVGGAMLILGGMALEKKRKEIKERFEASRLAIHNG